MTRTEFTDLMERHFNEIVDINRKKGADYSETADALANFKRAAERLDWTPEGILSVYLHKHLDAIFSYCSSGKVESEPIEGRIHDAILYLFLLMGLVEEKKVNINSTIVDEFDNVQPSAKDYAPVSDFPF